MASALEESQNLISPQISNLLINENYIKVLNQSIQDLLHEFRNGVPDVSLFSSKFYDFLQSRVNPPLEAIWVYTTLSFHGGNFSNGDVSSRVSIVKDLFQLISACSASCSASKSISLLAMVIHEVYKLALELCSNGVSEKKVKKAMKEIISLVESIVGYISVCCGASSEENGDIVSTMTSFEDLVSVWMKGNKGVESFLPLVSDEVRKNLGDGECDVSYLAGVVIVEAFLLRLCLKFYSGIPKNELEKDLVNWAIGSITGLKNYYFFETLLKMLLEPALPVTSLLNSEDEKLLRTVLYDAAILVDYSFLYDCRLSQAPTEVMKNVAISRLIVTHEATEFFRENGDPKRAISYLKAFSCSSLSSQLIRLVVSLIGTDIKASRPNGSSPKSLIKWLLNLENNGITIFDESHAKVVDVLKSQYAQLAYEAEAKKSDSEMLFYVDNKGEDEEEDTEEEEDEDKDVKESASAAFVVAAKTMKPAENDMGRKRKSGSSKKKKQIKFLKHNLYEKSESDVTSHHSSSSDSE